MIRQIIVPTSNIFNLQLQIPDNMIGKNVAVIFDEEETAEEPKQAKSSIESISEIFKDCRVNFGNYKFNRDEANNYE